MTENEAQQAMAHCAIFDFKVESHFMKMEYDSGNAIVVYRLAPMGGFDDHAVVMQYHKKDSQTPKADFYRDLDQFKQDLTGLVDGEVSAGAKVAASES